MTRFDPLLLHRIAREHGTPCYVYDAQIIRDRIAELRRFDVIRFAQKASSNIHLLKLMRNEGVVVDAVSLGEIERALRAGYSGAGEPAGIVYTADIFTEATLERVVERDIPVNAGSPDMLAQIGVRHAGHRVWIRINPGFGHGHSRKTNTGGESSKHGIWYEHLPDALRLIDRHDLRLVGLHMHIGSGTDLDHLKQVADAMVSQVRMLGRDLHAISAGGGIPIPYRAGDGTIDLEQLWQVWDSGRHSVQEIVGHTVQLEIEPGRFLVGEAGCLLAEVRTVKEMGKNRFVLVDAGFDNLMRPAMYGSHHEISILDPDGGPAEGPARPTVVGGPLCESGDVFTQEEGGVVAPRSLPPARVGGLAVFHDTGAYGASMASNYNSRTLAPEILVENGVPRLIRRRQTIDELLALEEI